MSETLTNGVIVPDKGSRDWYADLRSNWLKLDSLMAGGNITVNPAQTEGVLVATITVGGKEYKLYQQDGDVSVKIDPSAENAEYPLLASTSAEANTGSVVMAPAVTVNPSTGALTATSFKGKLDGNASTATNATKAVQDGAGAVIADTYATKKELGSKADDDNVVHKSGNETVNGAKLFTVAPLSANSDTTNGFFIRNNAIARNEVPSQFYHSAFRVYDKRDHIFGEYCVEKSTSGFSLLNMNVRSETADGTEISRGLFLTLGNDGSVVAFRPSTDNEFSLGISSFKWKDVNTTLLNGKTPAYAYNTTMITGAMHVGSVLTNGGKVVSFVVPINLNGSPTIAFTRLRLRYNGNYLFGSAGNSDVTTSYTFTTTVFNGGLIVTINFSDTDQNAINNSCIVAEIILKLTY